MCGIVGIGGSTPIAEPGRLAAMRDTLEHRGPDDAGLWWSPDRCVGLGHRRLSIIDLSAAGHQPMLDQKGQVCLTFNGEIYNFIELRGQLMQLGHSFRTGTDTEVIIEAYREWGLGSVTRFVGMFAICLFDAAQQRLFLARDRAGEKPLFYLHRTGRLIFASELRALLADPDIPRQIDVDSLNHYLAYGYPATDRSMLRDVRRLRQGEAMTYDLNRDTIHLWQYWNLPSTSIGDGASVDELTDQLEDVLRDAVRLQLTADVPVGIMLSGGIDSSIIAALAASCSSQPIRTFTISFPGEHRFDEATHARLVAAHYGTDHTELPVTSQDTRALMDITCRYDEPIADSSIIPTYLLTGLIRRHATVALGGDGGDELFGGYIHYPWAQRAALIRRFVPEFARSVVSRAATTLPVGSKGRNHLVGIKSGLGDSLAHFDMIFDHASRTKLLAPECGLALTALLSPEFQKAGCSSETDTPLRRATMADFRTYLVDDILTKVDRSSMLNSLEVRSPWLDHRVIEFAFSRVPDTFKVRSKEKKILPRNLAKRLLPKDLDMSRKQGFSIPIDRWFRGDWRDVIASILDDIDEGIFNRAFVRRLLKEQRAGLNNGKRLFALAMFELWRRNFLTR